MCKQNGFTAQLQRSNRVRTIDAFPFVLIIDYYTFAYNFFLTLFINKLCRFFLGQLPWNTLYKQNISIMSTSTSENASIVRTLFDLLEHILGSLCVIIIIFCAIFRHFLHFFQNVIWVISCRFLEFKGWNGYWNISSSSLRPYDYSLLCDDTGAIFK